MLRCSRARTCNFLNGFRVSALCLKEASRARPESWTAGAAERKNAGAGLGGGPHPVPMLRCSRARTCNFLNGFRVFGAVFRRSVESQTGKLDRGSCRTEERGSWVGRGTPPSSDAPAPAPATFLSGFEFSALCLKEAPRARPESWPAGAAERKSAGAGLRGDPTQFRCSECSRARTCNFLNGFRVFGAVFKRSAESQTGKLERGSWVLPTCRIGHHRPLRTPNRSACPKLDATVNKLQWRGAYGVLSGLHLGAKSETIHFS